MRIFFLLIVCFLVTGSDSVTFAAKESKTSVVELIPWKEVNEILPKYTTFTVHDLDTKLEFTVQRRAGSQHADVQPISAVDTKIMKEIYDGKWSWRRRAIIVKHNGRKIAASMHGMPHGAGALKNNFPGHFCIHFYGSKTHRSNFMDLSHKLMTLKAAGLLAHYLETADPYEVASAFIAGFKERDETIIRLISLQENDWDQLLSTIEHVVISRMPLLPAEDLVEERLLKIPIEIEWVITHVGRKTFRGSIQLVRLTTFDGWKIDSTRFLADHGFTPSSRDLDKE